MATEDVIAQFRLDLTQYQKDLETVKSSIASLDKNTKDLSDNMSKNIKGAASTTQELHQGLMQVAGVLGVAFSVREVINFGKESVKAFVEAEENARRLAVAVKGIGEEGEKAFKKLIAQSNQLQEVTIFSDDDIQRAQTALATFGLTAKQIEALIPKITDLASATDKDLGGATQKVIQGINGQIRGLKQVGITYEDTGSKTKNLGILMDKLGKFAGSAADAVNSTQGKWQRFGNLMDDIKEKIGENIVQSTEFRTASNLLELGLTDLTLAQLEERNILEQLSKINDVYFNNFVSGTNAQKSAILEYMIARSAQLRLDLEVADEEEKQGLRLRLQSNTDLLKKLTQETNKSVSERQSFEDDLTTKGLANKESAANKEKELRKKLLQDVNDATRESFEQAEADAAEFLAQEMARQKSIRDLQISTLKEGSEERLQAQIEAINAETEFRISSEELTLAQIETLRNESQARINELEEAQRIKDEADAEERFEELVAQNERQMELKKEFIEAELELEQTKFDALTGLTAAFANLVKDDAALAQSLLIFQKGLAIADILNKLQIEKAAWAATAAEQSVLDPVGAAVHQAVALARNQAANVRAAVSIATIIAQTIPQLKFAEGTEYLQRGKYRSGVDTIPIWADEGERIISRRDNLNNWDIYEALRQGKFDQYVSLNYVAPAMLEAQLDGQRSQDKSFAENVYNSMVYHTHGMSAKDFAKVLKRGVKVTNLPDDSGKISLLEYKLLERRISNAR